MSDYKVIGIDEIPARDNWIPIRDQLGIGAFGVNAYRGAEAGSSVISDHTELMARHEELYVVVEGHATFTVDGEEVDAPPGRSSSSPIPRAAAAPSRRSRGRRCSSRGQSPARRSRSRRGRRSGRRTARRWRSTAKQRYEDAAAVLRKALDEHPDSAGIEYNLACFETMAGSDAATVAEHLGRAIELYPGFRDFARQDSDFEPVKDDPAIQALMEEPK